MEKNKSWKRVAAFAVALTMVCSSIPSSFGSAGVFSSSDITASAEGDQQTQSKHSITVDANIKNGSVTLDKDSAAAGEDVTVTPSPAKGYVVKAVKLNGEQMAVNDEGKYVFEMPEKDVTVSAEFELTKYTLTIDSKIENGSVTVDKEKAAVGEDVTVTPSPAKGYVVKAVKLNGEQMAVNDEGKYVFEMPEKDVTVSAEFEKQYSITADPNIPNGSVTIDKQTAFAGEAVIVTPTPATGYKLKAVYANGDQVAINDKNQYAIEVVDKDLIISAVFVKETYSVTVVPSENGYVSVDKKKVEYDDSFIITPNPDEGYVVKEVTLDSDTVAINDKNEYAVAMPARDVFVSAEFVKIQYTVTIDNKIKNGKLFIQENKQEWDDEFGIAVTPDEGFAIKSVTVDGSEIKPEEHGVYVVKMPKKDITISAVFEKVDSEVLTQFKNYKENAKKSVDALVTESDDIFVSFVKETAKEMIDMIEYNSSQTLDQNKANVDKVLSDAKSDIENYHEYSKYAEEYENYLNQKRQYIQSLQEEDDDLIITDYIQDSADEILSTKYDTKKTLDENKKAVDELVKQIEADIKAKRELGKKIDEFLEYASTKKDYVESLAKDDDSSESKSIIKLGVDTIEELEYDDELSLEENKKLIDNEVNYTEKMLKQQRANDELSKSVRIFGKNRFDTSIEAANKFMADNKLEKLPALIIATGSDYADALSAAYLAKVKNAPIILTNTSADAIMNSTLDYIHKNCDKNTKIYIIGGQGAISLTFEKKLTSSAPIEQQYSVKRLEGKNRYLTNIAILKEAGVTNEELIIASGRDFADAISASSTAKPMLLVAGNKLTADQEAFVKGLKSDTAYIAGGTGAVSADIEKQLKGLFKNVARLGGKNRYETSALIAQQFCPRTDVIALAYGLSFPDGISGAPLAMYYGAPIVLATDKAIKNAVDYAKKAGVKKYVVFGGTSLISNKSVEAVEDVNKL